MILLIPISVSGQMANYWTPIGTNLQPISPAYGLKITKLASTGSPCVNVGTTGIFATTTCGGGGGSGTVSSGLTGQFPYYAANGTTLTATSSLFLATSGNVGVGTTTPQARLTVSGISNSAAVNALLVTNNLGVERFSVKNSGAWAASGNGTLGGNLNFTSAAASIQNNIGSINFTALGSYLFQVSDTGDEIDMGNIVTGAGGIHIFTPNTGGISLDAQGSGGVIQLTGGNVGVATTSPWRTLSVNGSSDLGTNALAGSFTGTTIATSTLVGGLSTIRLQTTATSTMAGINITSGCVNQNGTCLGAGSGTVNSGLQGQNAFYNANGTTVSGTSTEFFSTAGKVGFNTVSPSADVDVRGKTPTQSNADTVLSVLGSNGTLNFSGGGTNGGGASITGGNGGNSSSSASGDGGALEFYGGIGGDGTDATPGFGGNVYISGGNALNPGSFTNRAGNILLQYNKNGTVGLGNVGIGTTSPYKKLSVVGDSILQNASTSQLTNSGQQYDSTNSSGANANILSSTITGTKWIGTSTLATIGIPGIVCKSDVAATSTPGPICSYIVPANGVYRVGGYLNVTAVVTDVLQLQMAYTDTNTNAQTVVFFNMGATSGNISTTGDSSFPTVDIHPKSGTAITAQVVFTTGIGSVTYDVGSTIQQLH